MAWCPNAFVHFDEVWVQGELSEDGRLPEQTGGDEVVMWVEGRDLDRVLSL